MNHCFNTKTRRQACKIHLSNFFLQVCYECEWATKRFQGGQPKQENWLPKGQISKKVSVKHWKGVGKNYGIQTTDKWKMQKFSRILTYKPTARVINTRRPNIGLVKEKGRATKVDLTV